MERRPPADELPVPGLLPETGHQGADDQLRKQAHPDVRRHLEGPHLHQPPPSGGAVRGEELVDAKLGPVSIPGEIDKEIAEQPVDEPRARLLAAATQFLEGDLELVEALVTGLVDPRRLARRADEATGEEIGEGGMVVPVGDETGKEIRAPQKWAVGHRSPAEDEMIAAAGAGVPAVELELLRPQPADARGPVDRLPDPHELLPAPCRRHVDLNHPRIGRHLKPRKTIIPRRSIALEHHRTAVRCGDSLDAGQELEPVVDRFT